MKRVRWPLNSVYEDKAGIKAPNWPGGSRELVQLKMVYRWLRLVVVYCRIVRATSEHDLDLKDIMRTAGEVTFADAHKQHPNEGIVCFLTREDLERALDKLQGKEVNGRKLKLIDDSERRDSRSRSRSRRRSNSRSRSSRSRSTRSRTASKSRSPTPKKGEDSKSRSRSGSARSRSYSPEKNGSQTSAVVTENGGGANGAAVQETNDGPVKNGSPTPSSNDYN